MKLALITGASSGIGFELARVFAKNGYDLVINSNSERLDEKASILRQYEVNVTPIIADLATREGVDDLYRKASAMGPLDVVVLNAGVGVSGSFIENSFEDEWNMMNLNIVNLVYLAKLTVKDLSTRNNGRMLFTSSIAATMPGPYYAVYAASKAFVQSFAEAIRFEMKDMHKNVTITSLQPGATDTEFFDRAGMDDTPAGRAKKDDPAEVAQQGFDALMRGDDHVVAGSFLNKVQATVAKFMTPSQGAATHASQSRPDDTSKQH